MLFVAVVGHHRQTVVHLMCLRGNIEGVRELLARRLVVDIDARNAHGDTALHYGTHPTPHTTLAVCLAAVIPHVLGSGAQGPRRGGAAAAGARGVTRGRGSLGHARPGGHRVRAAPHR
jgi:hypothetical protein